MNEFTYDPRTLRYHDKNGKFVSEKKVIEITNQYLLNNKAQAAGLADQLIRHEITVPQWERAITLLLKDAHLTAYSLGKPGALTQSDYGRVGAQLKYQYRKLRNFSDEIISGKLSEAQIRNRTQLYFGKITESYWSGRRAINRENGAMWERRYLGGIHNCNPCLIYLKMGWQPIGVLPLPTNLCDCQSNCNCYMKYSTDISRPKG